MRERGEEVAIVWRRGARPSSWWIALWVSHRTEEVSEREGGGGSHCVEERSQAFELVDSIVGESPEQRK